jgi:hypothetical protein
VLGSDIFTFLSSRRLLECSGAAIPKVLRGLLEG